MRILLGKGQKSNGGVNPFLGQFDESEKAEVSKVGDQQDVIHNECCSFQFSVLVAVDTTTILRWLPVCRN